MIRRFFLFMAGPAAREQALLSSIEELKAAYTRLLLEKHFSEIGRAFFENRCHELAAEKQAADSEILTLRGKLQAVGIAVGSA